MDANRFDSLTRSLFTAGSRRLTLGALLGGALGALRLADTEARKSRKCKPTCTECNTCKKGKCKKKNGKKKCKKGKCQPKAAGTACTVATGGSGTCSGGVCKSGSTGPPVSPIPDQLPPQCNLPLTREMATQGSGTAGTNQCPAGANCEQTIQLTLQGALANTAFDVYIDQESAGDVSPTSHKFAGTFTTDAAGNAVFENTIVVLGACPSKVDNEIVLRGASVGAHQYIQQSFVPCAFC